ncbi:uncharacterized protein LOC131160633 [Malania oleifera]|uniref:uncharacterized protein LOC131160633 n=1 Tax=Malania oleifera TaxID=397392 RepID=UPI0025AE5A58|nr:uncharacterized protein LOC131160633 [Malania oleifera]
MMLQLADRSGKAPQGIIEDVLIHVDKFYYPVDFVVLEMQQPVSTTYQTPVILGRSFLTTSNALINCRSGVLKLTIGNMTQEMNVFNKTPIGREELEVHAVDMVDDLDALELFSAVGLDGICESESPGKLEVIDKLSIGIDEIPVRDEQWRPPKLTMLNITYPITDMSYDPRVDDIVNYFATNRTLLQDKRQFFSEVKIIFEKMGCPNHKAWLEELDDARWAYQAAIKRISRMTPYRLIYGLKKLQVHAPTKSKRKANDKDCLEKR